MKRIAFISHLDEISGGTIALVDTAAALQNEGFDCTLVLPGDGPITARASQHNLRVAVIGNPAVALTQIPRWRIPLLLCRRAAYTARMARYFRKQKFDLVYVNTSASVFPGVAAKTAGIPILWHIHETLTGKCPLTRIKKDLIRRLSSGLAYASQSGVNSFPPQSIPHLIVRNQVPMDSLREIRQRRQESKSSEPVQSARPSAPVLRLLANGIFPRKGADILFDAAAIIAERGEISPPEITLTGDGSSHPEYFNLLQTHRYRQKYRDRVHFVGVVPAMGPLFEKADAFVSASRNEALPIAIIEAMAAGVPVVATDVGDCADMLDDSRCGWVVAPESPMALAAAVTALATDPAEAKLRATAAAEKISRLYDPKDFWKPLVDFIRSLTN